MCAGISTVQLARSFVLFYKLEGITVVTVCYAGSWSSMDGWSHESGKFMAINLVTMSCRCGLSPLGMSPYTHLGDGCMDLILISQCGRIKYLKHLSRIPRQSADQVGLDVV